jgi:low affinity Fe/Cu permease
MCSGPLFHFSDTWQLVINTSTTIVTFLMVFLIQNTQNRDSHAVHLKLDELIAVNDKARNTLLLLEEFSDDEMKLLHGEFKKLRDRKGESASSGVTASATKTNEAGSP